MGLTRSTPLWQAFDKRLRELGWIDGQNLYIDFRSAEGKVERLPDLAADLARGVDLIVAPGSDFTLRAAKQVAGTRPIVFVAIDYDPLGLIDSLARPGGNVTGVFLNQRELTAKQLELIKEAIPRTKRVAVLWDAISADLLKAASQAAPALRLQLRALELHPPYDFDGALREAARGGADAALIMAGGPFAFQHRGQITQLALRHRIPAMFAFAEYAEAGGLMAYGADLLDMYRRTAEYVDRILRGAKPADLPVERPNKFQMVLNMKTARLLNLTVPTSVLLRADRVIE